MSLLKVEGVTLRYANGRDSLTAVEQVNFQVRKSDRYVLLGPSGCGKSTILKAVGGYIKPAAGSILLNGSPIKAPGPRSNLRLSGTRSAAPLENRQTKYRFRLNGQRQTFSAGSRTARGPLSFSKVDLVKFAGSYPHTLSGGMKQRVAIARAMAMQPQILLMDEPFASLDALTRGKMQDDLSATLRATSEFTLLFVTHSIPEALRIGTAHSSSQCSPRTGQS